ncbi:MAG: hypothetical protein HY287_15665 [Planctomycetes bacterium]|nr:hypothetical protein [Planctomycetota bacterium]MBI3835763.1 hypothetical protein [Planctomycetota bacterium]
MVLSWALVNCPVLAAEKEDQIGASKTSNQLVVGCGDGCTLQHISGQPYSPSGSVATPTGTTYSVSHREGADFDGDGPNPPQCIYIDDLALPGAPDDIVTFDGQPEAIRTDALGTVPTVTESEMSEPGGTQLITIETSSPHGTDLFPPGRVFQGTPLTYACFDVGLEDPLSWPGLDTVLSANIEYLIDGSTFMGPFDVLSFFPSPWNGTVELALPNGTGLGINGVRLSINLHKTVNVANDNCNDRTPIVDGTINFSNVGATTDGLDAGASCSESGYSDVGSDIWYSYTSSCTGTLTVDLCGSQFDTKVAVYDGCGRCPPNTTPIDCNDDFCGLRSFLTMPATQGHCYTIRVGGYQGLQGTGTLHVACQVTPPNGACCVNSACVGTISESSCLSQNGVWNPGQSCPVFSCPAPPNDTCNDCVRVLTGTTYSGTTVGSHPDLAAPYTSCGGGADSLDVWHCWTADCTGLVDIDTCTSSFDTTLSVFNACNGDELFCNDDGCAPLQSKVHLSVTSGQAFFFRVAGVNGATGSYKLRISQCSNACCTAQGQCFNVPATQCTAGGGVTQPAGTLCLGDQNGNGTDDACENSCQTANIQVAIPPKHTVDARQPFTPSSVLPRQGLGSPGVSGSPKQPIDLTLLPHISGAEGCFSICETMPDPVLGPLQVQQITYIPSGTYEFVFNHAITAGGVTTVKYNGGAGSFADYIRHPGNVNGDATADFNDAIALINCCLSGLCAPAFADYSCDIDFSTKRTPLDLLALMDVLNGAGSLTPWNNTAKPLSDTCP